MFRFLASLGAFFAIVYATLVAALSVALVGGVAIAIWPILAAFWRALERWPGPPGELIGVDASRLFGLGLGIAGTAGLLLGLLVPFRRR